VKRPAARVMDETIFQPAVQRAFFEASSQLVDGLVHDARNPLNALAINLEVLTDKISETSASAPTEKNVRAMREQIARIDEILRRFADFLAPKPGGPAQARLSEIVQSAVEVTAHQARKKRIRVSAQVQPGVTAPVEQAWSAHFLTLQAILRAIAGAEPGSEIEVALSRHEKGEIAFSVIGASGKQMSADSTAALEEVCRRSGATCSLLGGEWRLVFSTVRKADVGGSA
jgi:signal transduction histidine kinase